MPARTMYPHASDMGGHLEEIIVATPDARNTIPQTCTGAICVNITNERSRRGFVGPKAYTHPIREYMRPANVRMVLWRFHGRRPQNFSRNVSWWCSSTRPDSSPMAEPPSIFPRPVRTERHASTDLPRVLGHQRPALLELDPNRDPNQPNFDCVPKYSTCHPETEPTG